MQHDSDGNSCQQQGFIMGAVLSTSSVPAVSEFSTCSHDYLDSWFTENAQRATCLNNLPEVVYGDPICGNGFVEEGEDCDCGSTEDCAGIDDCCDAATCTFVGDAECSLKDPCCTDNCKIVTASEEKVCRPAAGECDKGDFCDGESASCPEDAFEITGISCQASGSGDGACYLGQCLSHEQYCASLDGLFTDGPYTACRFQEKLNQGNFCGNLYCSTPRDEETCYSFNLYGSIMTVPDGIPCDPGKQCYQGSCKKSSDLPGGDPITDVSGASILSVDLLLAFMLMYVAAF